MSKRRNGRVKPTVMETKPEEIIEETIDETVSETASETVLETTSETSKIESSDAPIEFGSFNDAEEVEAEEVKVSFDTIGAKPDNRITQEELVGKIQAFNSFVLGQKFTSEEALVNAAKMYLGSDVEHHRGMSNYEAFFMWHGKRIPATGVYHVRPF